jgi:hypothetical protein
MLRDIFKKKRADRVLPNQSTREISDTKERLNSELRACLYLYDDSKFIICALADIAEHGEPSVLDKGVSDDELGKTVCDKLLAFNPKKLAHHTEHTLSNWQAYIASGSKTAKAFERKSYYVYVRTINTAISIEARPRTTNEANLSAHYSASSGNLHTEVGAAIRKAINAAQLLRQAGAL